jgi:probable HAF family extracellular repeat protein
MRYLIRVFTLLCVVLSAPSIALPDYYTVDSATASDLGTFGGDEAEARDINDHGEVVGWARASDGKKRAFFYSGQMIDVGPPHSALRSHATGINNRRELVGEYWDSVSRWPYYVKINAGLIELSERLYNGQVPDGSFGARPFAINIHGFITGQAWSTADALPLTGCYWDLPVYWAHAQADPKRVFCAAEVYGQNIAYDVNNFYQVAGSEQKLSFVGFIWQSGVRKNVPKPSSAYRDLWIYGINDAGEVVGKAGIFTSDGWGTRAIYWDGVASQSRSLGVLPGGNDSAAFEINDQGFVAGSSTTYVFGTTRTRAFLRHDDFGLYMLPLPPGFSSFTSDCIANSLANRNALSGVVQVAGSCTKDGKIRAVRWQVVVPEHSLGIPSEP